MKNLSGESLKTLVEEWKKNSSLENALKISKAIAGTEWEGKEPYLWPVDLPLQQREKLIGQMQNKQLVVY